MAAPKLELVKTTMPGITQEIEARLRADHITLIEQVDNGEGKTNYVYSATYEREGLIKAAVVKVPRPLAESSATAYIGRIHKDLAAAEIAAKNALSHPNIIETITIIALKDGTRIPIEQRFNDAQSLEHLVRTAGPITAPAVVRHVFLQQLDALAYMHEQGFVHRDVKPANTLIDSRRHVKFTDMQMAVNEKDFAHKPEAALYTKGSAPYASLEMNNAFVSGKPLREWSSFVRNDLHGFGASLYYALTGEKLFSYSIDFDENGVPLTIDNTTITVSLKDDGKTVQQIRPIDHDKHLKEKLKAVPRKYRKLIRKLTTAGDDDYTTENVYPYNAIRDDLEKATSEAIDWRSIGRTTKRWAVAAGVAAGIIFGGFAVYKQDKQDRLNEPSPYVRLSMSPFVQQNFSTADGENLRWQDSQLAPSFAKVGRVANWVDGLEGNVLEHYNVISAMSPTQNKRFQLSLMRAILLHRNELTPFVSAQSRSSISFVPMSYVLTLFDKTENIHTYPQALAFTDELPERAFGFSVQYLSNCTTSRTDVADAYACFFADQSELFAAQQTAGNQSYFGYVDGQLHQHAGYGRFLPKAKRDAINTAVALYRLTDNMGAIHSGVLNANNKPVSGLEER